MQSITLAHAEAQFHRLETLFQEQLIVPAGAALKQALFPSPKTRLKSMEIGTSVLQDPLSHLCDVRHLRGLVRAGKPSECRSQA